MRRDAEVRQAGAVYKWLLGVLPERFRDEAGTAMREVFSKYLSCYLESDPVELSEGMLRIHDAVILAAAERPWVQVPHAESFGGVTAG